MKRGALALALLFVLLGVNRPAMAGDAASAAPALKFRQFDGQIFDLSAERGKVVIVSLWATWCPPCRLEMPVLDRVYQKLRDQGLVVVGLSADGKRHRDEAEAVMKEFHYPSGLREEAEVNDFGRTTELPVTYLIDRNGNLRATLTPDAGPLTEAKLETAVRSLLVK